MQVIFNSECYSIISYPDQGAFELVDKVQQRSGMLHGKAAEKFKSQAQELFAEDDIDGVDELIEDCGGIIVNDNAVH